METNFTWKGASQCDPLGFRSWCPACVAGNARDRMHLRSDEQGQKRAPYVGVHCCLSDSDGEDRLIPVLEASNRGTQMLFVRIAPQWGFLRDKAQETLSRTPIDWATVRCCFSVMGNLH